jgi:hypothetical protein
VASDYSLPPGPALRRGRSPTRAGPRGTDALLTPYEPYTPHGAIRQLDSAVPVRPFEFDTDDEHEPPPPPPPLRASMHAAVVGSRSAAPAVERRSGVSSSASSVCSARSATHGWAPVLPQLAPDTGTLDVAEIMCAAPVAL